MLSIIYEIQTCCDNCGRLMKREQVDQATFTALVAKADLAVEPQDVEERDQIDTGDLISEEEERPVEIYIRHEPVCSHCAESL